VDRLLATAIAVSNVIGNVVATLVIAKWEGAFDAAQFDAYLEAYARGEHSLSGSDGVALEHSL
jgi:aerobic C4-dicarboxylate transport protein